MNDLRQIGLLMVVLQVISCGGSTAVDKSAATSMDNIKTIVLGRPEKDQASSGTPAPAMPGKNVPAIKVNTVGYPTDWHKVVIFNVQPNDAAVFNTSGEKVISIAADKILHKGIDGNSQDPVWQVDISNVAVPGKYTVGQGETQSDVFLIGDDIYRDALTAGLKSFYFQRTRTALKKPYATWKGKSYTRKGISHAHKDVGWDLEFYPNKKKKWQVEGGWHDAGNYDMYIPSTAPSAQTLLLAYEWAPHRFDDSSLNNPESGNGVPDILDEVKWGLVWILSLQEPNGAFRHREAVMGWSPEVPADQDKEIRWIAGQSTSATAKAVAVLAMAADVYAKWDKVFSARCKTAAKKGWEFLKQTPQHIRADNKGSKQPLWDDEPGYTDVGARFVAACEMWRRFRDTTALEAVKKLMSAKETSEIRSFLNGAWANLSRLGLSTLSLDKETPEEVRQEAAKRLLQGADVLVHQATGEDGYRCVSRAADYFWAHNSNLMEKVHILSVAHKLSPEKAVYLEVARDQWHWVLGRNPNGYSMVTGVGRGPDRMYHMEWGQAEPPPPGFLLGGPNAVNMGFLAPNAPAKALLWDNPKPLRSGLAAHSLWHWRQSDLWDGGFIPEGAWTEGWWAVSEPDILYSANFVLAAVVVK
ncbi:MAG: glycoside hydrolase family 9 protein [Myxococcota bacterium]|nr:glycoside hydrolase family 9 protein [Myxococcota bacterium]